MRIIFTVAAILIVAGCASVSPAGEHTTASIKGKVVNNGVLLPGATVYLYKNPEGGFRNEADYMAGPTDIDGAFEVKVEPASYFIMVLKEGAEPNGKPDQGDLFSYYGGNPVVVGESQLINIGVNAVEIIAVNKEFTPDEDSGLKGIVYFEGKPLGGARVTLYQDSETIFRGIGYASAFTSKGGKFFIPLEAGSYYVVARKRMTEGKKLGPLAQGDLFAFAHENPVTVKEAMITELSINAVAKRIKVKEEGQEVTLGGTVGQGYTTISGVILDEKSNPVKGVHVGAYRDSMMIYKPDFISNKTGSDGAYTIELPGAGNYYLLARNTMGGPAVKGDRMGYYSVTQDHSLKIEDGEKLIAVDIVIEEVQ
jgi:hypothetical protein